MNITCRDCGLTDRDGNHQPPWDGGVNSHPFHAKSCDLEPPDEASPTIAP